MAKLIPDTAGCIVESTTGVAWEIPDVIGIPIAIEAADDGIIAFWNPGDPEGLK